VTRGEAKRGGERPERLRVFAALDLPGAAIDSIAAWQGQALAGQQRLRPIEAGNLHLTLAFLGDRDPAEVERVAAAVTALDASGPVRLRLLPEPVGLPRRRPRVIAFDVESDAAIALQQDLGEGLRVAELIAAAGTPARPFRPHLRVARVRGDPPRGRAARDFVAGLAPLGKRAGHTFDAVRVALYRSELQSQGARYSVLADVELPHRSGG
jgi:2'-5' RNA ligase